jgi:hypothetical protein
VNLATKELFDKKFVVAAIILGIVYALIVVLVGTIISKEAAGIAGVALTALATALFTKVENLQFRRMSDEESIWVEVPPISIWRVTVLTFAFVGAEYLLGVASAAIPETFLANWQFTLFAVGATPIVYFILSFVVAKAFVRLRYSTVAFAVLLTQITSVLVALVRFRPVVAYVLQYGLGPTIGVQGGVANI